MEWALEAGDRLMMSWVLYRRGEHAAADGDAAAVAGLAAAARREGEDLPGPMLAAIRQQEAHAHALDGDEAACQAALDQAQEQAASPEDPGDASNGHGSFCTPAYVEMQRGRCWLLLGQPAKAKAALDTAIRSLPPVYRRDRGVALSALATAFAAIGEPGEAAIAAMQALAVARDAGSERIIGMVIPVATALAPYRSIDAVAQLREALAGTRRLLMASAAEVAAMRRAIALSAAGLGTTSPNPPVGCVLLDPQAGSSARDTTSAKAKRTPKPRPSPRPGPLAAGATAVVTLEPCNHQGRTPPCRQTLIDAGIRRAVIAVIDPTSRGEGGVAELRRAGVDVETGVLAGEARTVLGDWLAGLRNRRPVITWPYLITGRGIEALPADTSEARQLRLNADAVLGADGTVREAVPGSHGKGILALRDQPPGDGAAAAAALYDGGVRRLLLDGGLDAAMPFLDSGLVDRVVAYLPHGSASRRPAAEPPWPLLPPGFVITGATRTGSFRPGRRAARTRCARPARTSVRRPCRTWACGASSSGVRRPFSRGKTAARSDRMASMTANPADDPARSRDLARLRDLTSPHLPHLAGPSARRSPT